MHKRRIENGGGGGEIGVFVILHSSSTFAYYVMIMIISMSFGYLRVTMINTCPGFVSRG